MRIDGNDINLDALFQVQNNEQRTDAQDQERVRQLNQVQDRLEFSTDSRNIQPLVDRAKEAPDVRAERVAQIRGQLEAGTYNIRAERVADAIITGSIVDSKA